MDTAEDYADVFEEGGRQVTVERFVENGPSVLHPNVRARIRGYQPSEIVGNVQSGRRTVLLLAEDLPSAFVPEEGDDIHVDGDRLKVLSVDNQTHRDGEVLLAYDVTVAGA